MARFNKLKEEVTRENVSDKEGENNVQRPGEYGALM